MGLIFNRQRKTKAESKHYYHTTLLYGDKECIEQVVTWKTFLEDGMTVFYFGDKRWN